MELGQYQLQVFVSLIVILGAAFVALICDFLKGTNERLRELTIELKVRREEEQRHAQTLTAHPAMATGGAAPGVVNGIASGLAPEMAPETAPETAMTAAAQRGVVKAEKRAEQPGAARERKRPFAAEALAAMERGAHFAASPQAKTRPAPAPAAAAAQQGRASGHPKTLGVFTKKDWNSLLSRRPQTVKSAEVRENPVETAGVSIPKGFYDGQVLARLVKSRMPVSGLVVSIGVNTGRKTDGRVPSDVKNLIQSLIGPQDFACQSAEEEFLLIYPRENGAAAQRRLSEIAQQLWNFQLATMGAYAVVFSWGGVEVNSESMEEAIASANERMQETRRGRRLLTLEPRELRQAV